MPTAVVSRIRRRTREDRVSGARMRLAETERELADKTTRFVKAELKRAGVTYGEIAQRLEQQGLKETRLRQPIARQSNCSRNLPARDISRVRHEGDEVGLPLAAGRPIFGTMQYLLRRQGNGRIVCDTVGSGSDMSAPGMVCAQLAIRGVATIACSGPAAPVVMVWGMSCVTVVAVTGAVGWLAWRLRPNAPPPMSGRSLAVAD